jgi:transposase
MSATMTTVCKKMAVAVEIASAKWVVASYAGGAHKIRCKTLTQATAAERLDGLLAEMDEARRRFELEATARVMVAYEAGQEGFWLVRALAERGLDARVIDPVSLPVDRRARRAKTDRLDARALVLGVWRYLHGEGGTVRMVRVADAVAEDAREWQRERDRLARERRSCADRIRKKLRTQGIWSLPPDWHAALREGAATQV